MHNGHPLGVGAASVPAGPTSSGSYSRTTGVRWSWSNQAQMMRGDWDAFDAARVRPNLRRHISQLQDYLDHYIDHLRHTPDQAAGPAGDPAREGDRQPLTCDTVIGVLLYPKRPHDPARAQLVEALALQQALTVVWYDETDWSQQASTPPARPIHE
jgi:hypothetical protein